MDAPHQIIESSWSQSTAGCVLIRSPAGCLWRAGICLDLLACRFAFLRKRCNAANVGLGAVPGGLPKAAAHTASAYSSRRLRHPDLAAGPVPRLRPRLQSVRRDGQHLMPIAHKANNGDLLFEHPQEVAGA